MHITIIMVLTYIACCVRIGVAPWRYFQLNARYFSAAEGIFSKQEINDLVPERWRLTQDLDDETLLPASYPVFYKPEWGQNAHGIHRVDNPTQLLQLRASLPQDSNRYLVQQAAPGQREYEIFSIDADRSDQRHDILTITEAVNLKERWPINSKYNHDTCYADITSRFGEADLATIAGYVSEIGQFGISRMSVRADSEEQLLAGNFHVIEINLFLPMPINLLDRSYGWRQRWRFIRKAMMALAQSTRLIRPVARPQPIFTLMMLYERRRTRQRERSIKPASPNLGNRYLQP